MNLERIVGLGAATLTTVAFVPQVWRSLKTHDTRGISLSMYAVFTSGVALWLAYGVLLGDLPIILANIVTLALASIVLVLKIRYG